MIDQLPPPLMAEILSRLDNSVDLARCRLVCRAFRELSGDVRAVALICSRRRLLRSRAHLVPSFTSLLPNLISIINSSLESISIAADNKSFNDEVEEEEEEDFDDADDLHLTGARFLETWMPRIGGRLTSLVIWDYWRQSCWRRSNAMSVISHYCSNLINLEIRNAWLSLDGLDTMSNLTTLTLEFIRLDDENLDKVNSHFPVLQILRLIGVGGLKYPKIHLPQLKICDWIVSSVPLALCINAPNLVELKLRCIEPKFLSIKTPLLQNLNLIIKSPTGVIEFGSFQNLNSLKMVSSDLPELVRLFTGSTSVKKVELEALECVNSEANLVSCTNLIKAFPNMDVLMLGSGLWYQLEGSLDSRNNGSSCGSKLLKKLAVHLPLKTTNILSIAPLLNLSAPSCEVTIVFHSEETAVAKKHLIAEFSTKYPKIKWKWVMQQKAS